MPLGSPLAGPWQPPLGSEGVTGAASWRSDGPRHACAEPGASPRKQHSMRASGSLTLGAQRVLSLPWPWQGCGHQAPGTRAESQTRRPPWASQEVVSGLVPVQEGKKPVSSPRPLWQPPPPPGPHPLHAPLPSLRSRHKQPIQPTLSKAVRALLREDLREDDAQPLPSKSTTLTAM